jgi:hypothetical protein
MKNEGKVTKGAAKKPGERCLMSFARGLLIWRSDVTMMLSDGMSLSVTKPQALALKMVPSVSLRLARRYVHLARGWEVEWAEGVHDRGAEGEGECECSLNTYDI